MTCTCAIGQPTCPFCVQHELTEWNAELDALAECAGENLRLDYDTEAPFAWAVWSHDGTENEDIIGAGNTPAEAIADARRQIEECMPIRLTPMSNPKIARISLSKLEVDTHE